MRPRPSLAVALENESITRTEGGALTGRSLAKSVYNGFNTTKHRDLKLCLDSSARKSVIEFPNHNQQQTPQASQKQIPFFGGTKFTSSYSNWNYKQAIASQNKGGFNK